MKQVIIEISDNAYKAIIGSGYVVSDFNMISTIRNGTILSENPTNGDMIKAMFPNYESRYDTEYEIITGHLDKTHRHNFDLDWWNAPYEGGQDERDSN